jgi:hypothetical protein
MLKIFLIMSRFQKSLIFRLFPRFGRKLFFAKTVGDVSPHRQKLRRLEYG